MLSSPLSLHKESAAQNVKERQLKAVVSSHRRWHCRRRNGFTTFHSPQCVADDTHGVLVVRDDLEVRVAQVLILVFHVVARFGSLLICSALVLQIVNVQRACPTETRESGVVALASSVPAAKFVAH